MATKTAEWKTAITKIEPNRITIHGYAVDELMGNLSYAGGVYLMLKGKLPDEKQEKMLNTILISSIDHGVTPPSVLAALTSASTGANLSQCLASGILSINQYHGGAIENCQKMLIEALSLKNELKMDVQTAAHKLVMDAVSKKKRLPGLGHRIHTDDPRTKKLFSIADDLGFSGDYIEMIKAIAKAFEEIKGKKLPVNVDGAIAAVLCEMEFPPQLGNAFFMIARMPGILAHVAEEWQRQKPMRKINPHDYTYDGPEYRPYPG